jgi:hypothetical protein
MACGARNLAFKGLASKVIAQKIPGVRAASRSLKKLFRGGETHKTVID